MITFFFENALIDLLIPAIYYFEDERIGPNLSTVIYIIENDFDILIESDKKLKEAKCKMLAKDIIAVRNHYKYLTYFNQNGFQPFYLTNFKELVYKFLKDKDIWEIKSYEDDQNGYFWQTEWDIEYKQILNITYFANSLKEVNDIYKLVWMIWLCDIYNPVIHNNAKIIWKNIDY